MKPLKSVLKTHGKRHKNPPWNDKFGQLEQRETALGRGPAPALHEKTHRPNARYLAKDFETLERYCTADLVAAEQCVAAALVSAEATIGKVDFLRLSYTLRQAAISRPAYINTVTGRYSAKKHRTQELDK